MASFAYVGCRTSTWRGARGKGIEVFHITDSGAWQHVQCIASVQENPSWLTLDPGRKRLYALHGDGDRVAVYDRNENTGLLTLVSDQTTGPRHRNPALDPQRRNNPVGSSLTPDNAVLLIANHEGGNIAALTIEPDGLAAPSHLAFVEGHPQDDVQSLSRPHEIVFAPGSALFAVPMQGRPAGNGIDMVRLYRWNGIQSELSDEVQLAEGSWPRHVDFHPSGQWLYGVSELSSTVSVFAVDLTLGKLTLIQTLSALPEGYTARSDASEIEVHPSGRFLYVANRGHDSIAIFAIDAQNGTLAPLSWVPCGGKTPRFTTLSPDGKQFYSANEDSDTIQVFNVDLSSGMLIKTNIVIEAASPTCICFV
ncbi:lactonase family protein [Pantoea coffeiphila]|uniref:lactonase family protein n=1 Tax=Pantoea coffeiphila TaxID=1465635 RepID=UPI00195F8184|nr:lactonase family protein [Pantoea coffeiphila]MBM7344845.1 6-phosphogluconolactonase (cycloisomerase 2 family) [Pantoea coffeiphila]